MRLSRMATVGILLVLALVLPGCGGDRTATAERKPVARRSVDGRPPATTQCRRQLHGFLGAMSSLRRRLAVGLDYPGYLSAVHEARAAYGEVPVRRLGIGCLASAGTPGERALNRYLQAANAWGDCLASASCDLGAVEPRLQRRWALASDLLSSARQAVRKGEGSQARRAM
jgi:hypothetical protein